MTKLNLDFLKPGRRRVSLDARKARAGYVFALPFILGIILIYLPIVLDSIWFSFTEVLDVNGVQEIKYVGLQYYEYAFLKSTDFTSTLLEGVQHANGMSIRKVTVPLGGPAPLQAHLPPHPLPCQRHFHPHFTDQKTEVCSSFCRYFTSALSEQVGF